MYKFHFDSTSKAASNRLTLWNQPTPHSTYTICRRSGFRECSGCKIVKSMLLIASFLRLVHFLPPLRLVSCPSTAHVFAPPARSFLWLALGSIYVAQGLAVLSLMDDLSPLVRVPSSAKQVARRR